VRLDFIRPLYERQGPYASLYLAADRGPHELIGGLGGADRASLEALEEQAEPGHAVFAAHGDVVLSEALPGGAGPELAHWSPLPRVTPMLVARGENVPHVRVVADHAGAELTVVGGGSPRTSPEAAAPWPLHRTARGGWSRRRFDAWEQGAGLVAAEIDEQVRRIGAELVLLAGEPAARSALCDRLGTKAADRVLMVEQGDRTDREGCDADAVGALDAWIEQRRQALLYRHFDTSGPIGLHRVGHALREGRAQAVLTPGELDVPAWVGKGGTQLATTREELLGWGVEHPVPERADSALARAAAMTDAELWFCPQLGDVAAVLR
jgi:hypothetical protein